MGIERFEFIGVKESCYNGNDFSTNEAAQQQGQGEQSSIVKENWIKYNLRFKSINFITGSDCGQDSFIIDWNERGSDGYLATQQVYSFLCDLQHWGTKIH